MHTSRPGVAVMSLLDGIRRVEARHVSRAVRRHLRPSDYTILIVGDTTPFDPAKLGHHTVLPYR
jgi:hypothetical protein